MAKPFTSWLVPSFSHVAVTKFQDKFASLKQVNSMVAHNNNNNNIIHLYSAINTSYS